MCKIGDILLIYNAYNHRKPVGAHPFIVLDDSGGRISGVYSYDFIGLLLTSADTPEKKERLGKIDSNFPIAKEDKIIDKERMSDNRYSYLEANEFFYFDKSKIKYVHIGRIEPDIYNLILEFIEEITEEGIRIKRIVDKATKIECQEGD